MQTYHVKLESEIFKTYKCQRAANSLDIDIQKKSIHELKISCDLNSKFNIGLILGASGSGKTTLVKNIFGEDCFKIILNENLPIIDQFPDSYSYEECANILTGIGLTSVPCWIRPVKTLSNGQKARAEAALLMTQDKPIICIDEWTSVVDRTVAKAMSNCVQKMAKKLNKNIILLSCHYDVIEWLDPDWLIDCNKQEFIDRRLLPVDQRKRTESIKFDIREVRKSTWKYFSKYHYLSENILPGTYYGLFHGDNQIGFLTFSNYVPHKKGKIQIWHLNRIVIHPDYVGLGLGIKFSNECCKLFKAKKFVKIFIKLSSKAMIQSLIKNKQYWVFTDQHTTVGRDKRFDHLLRKGKATRNNIKTYSFQYIGP